MAFAPTQQTPTWTSQLTAVIEPKLTGDRIQLPASILDQLVSQTTQLPSPLIFEMRRDVGDTGNDFERTHGTVREFTAADGVVALSPDLAETLGIRHTHRVDTRDVQPDRLASDSHHDETSERDEPERPQLPHDGNDTVTLRLVTLPKCTYAKLHPLTNNYTEITDMRSILESHLRRNHATLTRGETFVVKGLAPPYRCYPFRVDVLVPGDACLCLDTDMEVDIVSETMDTGEGSGGGSARIRVDGNDLVTSSVLVAALQDIGVRWLSPDALYSESIPIPTITAERDQIVYFKVPCMPQTNHIKMSIDKHTGDTDCFVSLVTEHPHALDHDWFDVEAGRHVEIDVDLDSPFGNGDDEQGGSYGDGQRDRSAFVYVAVVACVDRTTFRVQFITSKSTATVPKPVDTLASTNVSETVPVTPAHDQGVCLNCGSTVPLRTLQMHTAFCERNNRKCDKCGGVFKKEDFGDHWHCEICEKAGHISEKDKHMDRFHKAMQCECGLSLHLQVVLHHRRHECPDRLIICRFCHLHVRAGALSKTAKDLYLGTSLTEHESDCGARTISCQTCHRNIQLKDVQTHMRLHDMSRAMQPTPSLCSNTNCAAAEHDSAKNVLRSCPQCFAPFWSPSHDPGNQKLMQKVFGAYHRQLTEGCHRESCYNKYCVTSVHEQAPKSPMDATDAAVMSLDLFKTSFAAQPDTPQHHFCITDATLSKRRYVAETVLVPLGFRGGWCVRALQTCRDDVDRAASWLIANAPKI